jgi:hypothetical protein
MLHGRVVCAQCARDRPCSDTVLPCHIFCASHCAHWLLHRASLRQMGAPYEQLQREWPTLKLPTFEPWPLPPALKPRARVARQPRTGGLPTIGRCRPLSRISGAARMRKHEWKSRAGGIHGTVCKRPWRFLHAADAFRSFVPYAPASWASQVHTSSPKATRELRSHTDPQTALQILQSYRAPEKSNSEHAALQIDSLVACTSSDTTVYANGGAVRRDRVLKYDGAGFGDRVCKRMVSVMAWCFEAGIERRALNTCYEHLHSFIP